VKVPWAIFAAAALLLPSAGLAIPLGKAPAPDQALTPVADALLTARALEDATTWTERVLPLARHIDPTLQGPQFREDRSLEALVDAVYVDLGVAFPDEDRTAFRAEVAALHPRLAFALQQLLGATDVGMRDWREATAQLTKEDWETLTAYAPEDLAGGRETPSPAWFAALDKMDTSILLQSTMRFVHVMDGVIPLFQEVAMDPEPAGRAPPFPGPNSGVLFNDPFNIILVGDVVKSVYWGNTFPYPLIGPADHILIVDLGGDDEYRNHPATARAGGLCYVSHGSIGDCDSGVSASLVVDLAGSDLYAPEPYIGSTAMGAYGGVGILTDVTGNDVYLATHEQVSQAFSDAQGISLLLDATGSDKYYGGAATHAASTAGLLTALVDVQGDDYYRGAWASQASNAFSEGGASFFVDLQGDDYVSADAQSQGFIYGGGLAMALDVGGSDYHGALEDSRGWAAPCLIPPLVPECSFPLPDFAAVFLDVCGFDTYAGYVGRDNTVWQQTPLGYGEDARDTLMCPQGND